MQIPDIAKDDRFKTIELFVFKNCRNIRVGFSSDIKLTDYFLKHYRSKTN